MKVGNAATAETQSLKGFRYCWSRVTRSPAIPARSTDRRHAASSSRLSRYRPQASSTVSNPPSMAARSSALRRLTQWVVMDDGKSSRVRGPSGPMTDFGRPPLISSTANAPFARLSPLCAPRSRRAPHRVNKIFPPAFPCGETCLAKARAGPRIASRVFAAVSELAPLQGRPPASSTVAFRDKSVFGAAVQLSAASWIYPRRATQESSFLSGNQRSSSDARPIPIWRASFFGQVPGSSDRAASRLASVKGFRRKGVPS